MSVNEQGHYGKYSGNSRHTRVTSHNFAATRRDDQAHMQYLKEDIDYDAKHGHSDIDMTADEKHISKLAGDLKYDDKHHGAAKLQDLSGDGKVTKKDFLIGADVPGFKEGMDGAAKRYLVK